jgi:hypothetical protein
LVIGSSDWRTLADEGVVGLGDLAPSWVCDLRSLVTRHRSRATALDRLHASGTLGNRMRNGRVIEGVALARPGGSGVAPAVRTGTHGRDSVIPPVARTPARATTTAAMTGLRLISLHTDGSVPLIPTAITTASGFTE